MKTVVLLVGEVSGDSLAAELIRRIKSQNLTVRFVGIGGEKMIAEGFESLIDMEHLSVMGADTIRQLPKLLLLRSHLIKQLIKIKPDLLVGIDAPDFNFFVEKKLKRLGIPVWHWVSPSIWAWRRGRIKKIIHSCDEIMCLFPQEPALYKGYAIKASFYGHPMADEIPLESHLLKEEAYQKLHSQYHDIIQWQEKTCIALLPGSRFGEVKYMLPLYLTVAKELLKVNPQLRFILPIAKESLTSFFQEHYQSLDESTKEKILLVNGQARECMLVSDLVLLASGTATLEAMLLKKPMVVAHQGPKINHWIYKYIVYTPYVTLPNFMENGFLIKELLFDDATPSVIIDSIDELMNDSQKKEYQMERFRFHHRHLKQHATDKISDKIIEHLCNGNTSI